MEENSKIKFLVGGFLAGVVLTLGIAYLARLEMTSGPAKELGRQDAARVEPAAAPTPQAPSAPPAVAAVPQKPVAVPDSAPFRGPKDAPITLMEFSDFHCPFCKRIAPTMEQLLQKYEGKVRWIFRHYPLPMHPGADRTHMASACAQDQGKFWEFHDAIFALAGAPQESDYQAISQKLGLDGKRFQECLQTGKYKSLVEQELEAGKQKMVVGTPTVFVNDKMVPGAYPLDFFVNIIEGILDPSKAQAAPPLPTPGAPPTPAAPAEFKDLEGRPALGPENAQITLVEFSDFHCPFCKRVSPTIEQLMKTYEGKIRRVWRHNPLAMHQGAGRTHEASECAHEQGKFWEYHDKIFAGALTSRDDAGFNALAQAIGLDTKQFAQCLQDGKYKDLVQKEVEAGKQVGVRGTPAIFINGRLIPGAQPYENFDRVVQAELSKPQPSA
jgi:protein-disulfide isomerase